MDLPLCRLCLAPSSATVALFDDATMQPNVLLLQKVVECTSIKLSAEEDYPSSVCTDCERKLNEWSTFKIQCIVNNDFYRQKQQELRQQLVVRQNKEPSPEVVCLDDDEDESPQQNTSVAQQKPVPPQSHHQQQQPARRRRQESPAKKLKVVEEVIIDDDDEEDQIKQSNGQYQQEQDFDSSLLDDYQLVEGQEVDQFPMDSEYETLPDAPAEEYDDREILTSILLDDDDDEEDDDRHTGGREQSSYQCWQCMRSYSSMAKLRTHVKLHSERMRCFVCGKMIVLQLVRHMRSQHPGQTFPEPVRCWHAKCANSPELFYNVDQLLEHMDAKKRK